MVRSGREPESIAAKSRQSLTVSSWRPLSRRPAGRLATMCVLPALIATACGGSGSHSAGGNDQFAPGSTLVIADFDPFSGPNAPYGFTEEAGCIPAINLINKAGGVLGHKLACQVVDDRGDPADAVPAAQKLLATTSNLIAIVDQNSGLLTATTPIFNAAKIPEVSIGGDVPFDKNKLPYFWRTIPGDDVAGFALAAYLKSKTSYTKVAGMFTTDSSAQGNVPGLQQGVANLGLDLVINQGLAIDQSSYATEIQRMLAASPQVMAMESDPQTAGVLFGQMKQAGALLPTVLTSGTAPPDWDKAVVAAIGQSDFKKYMVRLVQYADSSGPAWTAFNGALLAAAGQVQDASQHTQDIYAEDPYDNVNMIALAILAAKSTDPKQFNAYIPKVVAKGGTVVHTFAEGKAALAAGHSIDYVGVEGQINFDQYHNSAGVWGVFEPLTNRLLAQVTAAEVQQAETPK
jgi:ABC-type branched-subunit amino acid transport system substrate-binding protein